MDSTESNERIIRIATAGDAEAIAGIHVASWRTAYQGLVPDALLAGLSEERRTTFWRQELERELYGGSDARTWIAERAGRVIGFCGTGPTTDDDAVEATAEIFTIYVEPDSVGTGTGRALFVHATDDFRRRDFVHATLWVLASNTRTRRFYEAGGWHFDGATKTETFGEWPLDLARYRISLAGGGDAGRPS